MLSLKKEQQINEVARLVEEALTDSNTEIFLENKHGETIVQSRGRKRKSNEASSTSKRQKI